MLTVAVLKFHIQDEVKGAGTAALEVMSVCHWHEVASPPIVRLCLR